MATHVDMWCDRCGSETKQRAYLDRRVNKTYYTCVPCQLEHQRKKRRTAKLKAIEYKGGCCSACGGDFRDHPGVYEFHHIDPSEKDGLPSNLLAGNWKKAKKELDKCVLLCANCHRIAHEEDYV